MPTYQYACTECGEQLEAVQSFSDPALTECPSCQGRLRKVFNSVGIVFKGSGFYRNDSRPTEKSDAPAKAPAAGTDSSASTPATAATPAASSTPAATSTSSTTTSSGAGSSGAKAAATP